MDRRKKCRPPVVHSAVQCRRTDRDKIWQVLVFAAQSIPYPGPHAGPDKGLITGVKDVRQSKVGDTVTFKVKHSGETKSISYKLLEKYPSS